MHGDIEVDLFTDGRGIGDGNYTGRVYNLETDDAFAYPWVGSSFCGKPVYNVDFIFSTLKNARSDFGKDAVNV